MRSGLLFSAAIVCGFATAASAGIQSSVVTFDNGWEGWNGAQGPGGSSQIEPAGGNPGAHAHTIFNNFGIEWTTDSNSAFIGDLTQYSSVTLSIDVKVESISFFGQNVSRNLILDARSFSLGQNGYPWSSVWFNMGAMPGTGQDWTTYSVTFNPNADALPEGWGGYGAEDPNTFEPMLPENLTFADVMGNIEQLAFSTYEPGFFYGFTDFDIRVDNIRIEATPIPAPAALPLLIGGLGLAARRRRRRRH